MIEIIIAGILQGILEWLPVSSQGIITYVMRVFFQRSFEESINLALFLHFGTMMSTIVYFRKDLKKLWDTQTNKDFEKIGFLFIATTLSFIIAGILLLIINLSEEIFFAGGTIIGVLLIITGVLQLIRKNSGRKGYDDIRIKNGIIPGILQGFSILPGISRSGITLFGLIYSGFNLDTAFKISFLMAIPVVFFGDIVLGIAEGLFFRPEYLIGIIVSFAIGLVTIDSLIKISKKYNFGTLCILLGLLSIIIEVMF